VKTNGLRILFSLLLFIIITLACWPVYVACSLAVSHFGDALGVIDFIDSRPKRLLLTEFLEGWKQSLPLASAIGLLAVIDRQLFARKRSIKAFSGLTLLVAFVAMPLLFFKSNALELMPTFALTGCVLWLTYRTLGFLSRLGNRRR